VATASCGEANYWYLLCQASAEVPDLGPRRAEAERDQAVTAAANASTSFDK
jgi:hypothetical protein